MRRTIANRYLTILCTWLALSALGADAHPLDAAPFLEPMPVRAGESLVYDVKLGRLSAGTQSLDVTAQPSVGGERVLRLVSDAAPSPLLDKVYHFKDRKVSYISAATMLPTRYEKLIEDRSYRGDFSVAFDRDLNTATVWRDGKREQRDRKMPQGVLDELSMVYYLRTKDLVPGVRYEYTFFTGTRLFDVAVDVLRYEYYTAPAPLGRVKTLRLQASDGFSVWITADERRIPVRIEAPIRVFGKLVATLRGWSGIPGISSRIRP
ncbi:DUF3108 domain-containing protein [Candidatus Poribacteria bacterium]|nr:DUF3108 domain-containing protein [Candidatus Poribacteria bacterium]